MERTRDKTIYALVKPVETEPGYTDNMAMEASFRQEPKPDQDVNSADHIETGTP